MIDETLFKIVQIQTSGSVVYTIKGLDDSVLDQNTYKDYGFATRDEAYAQVIINMFKEMDNKLILWKQHGNQDPNIEFILKFFLKGKDISKEIYILELNDSEEEQQLRQHFKACPEFNAYNVYSSIAKNIEDSDERLRSKSKNSSSSSAEAGSQRKTVDLINNICESSVTLESDITSTATPAAAAATANIVATAIANIIAAAVDSAAAATANIVATAIANIIAAAVDSAAVASAAKEGFKFFLQRDDLFALSDKFFSVVNHKCLGRLRIIIIGGDGSIEHEMWRISKFSGSLDELNSYLKEKIITIAKLFCNVKYDSGKSTVVKLITMAVLSPVLAYFETLGPGDDIASISEEIAKEMLENINYFLKQFESASSATCSGTREEKCALDQAKPDAQGVSSLNSRGEVIITNWGQHLSLCLQEIISGCEISLDVSGVREHLDACKFDKRKGEYSFKFDKRKGEYSLKISLDDLKIIFKTVNASYTSEKKQKILDMLCTKNDNGFSQLDDIEKDDPKFYKEILTWGEIDLTKFKVLGLSHSAGQHQQYTFPSRVAAYTQVIINMFDNNFDEYKLSSATPYCTHLQCIIDFFKQNNCYKKDTYTYTLQTLNQQQRVQFKEYLKAMTNINPYQAYLDFITAAKAADNSQFLPASRIRKLQLGGKTVETMHEANAILRGAAKATIASANNQCDFMVTTSQEGLDILLTKFHEKLIRVADSKIDGIPWKFVGQKIVPNIKETRLTDQPLVSRNKLAAVPIATAVPDTNQVIPPLTGTIGQHYIKEVSAETGIPRASAISLVFIIWDGAKIVTKVHHDQQSSTLDYSWSGNAYTNGRDWVGKTSTQNYTTLDSFKLHTGSNYKKTLAGEKHSEALIHPTKLSMKYLGFYMSRDERGTTVQPASIIYLLKLQAIVKHIWGIQVPLCYQLKTTSSSSKSSAGEKTGLVSLDRKYITDALVNVLMLSSDNAHLGRYIILQQAINEGLAVDIYDMYKIQLDEFYKQRPMATHLTISFIDAVIEKQGGNLELEKKRDALGSDVEGVKYLTGLLKNAACKTPEGKTKLLVKLINAFEALSKTEIIKWLCDDQESFLDAAVVATNSARLNSEQNKKCIYLDNIFMKIKHNISDGEKSELIAKHITKFTSQLGGIRKEDIEVYLKLQFLQAVRILAHKKTAHSSMFFKSNAESYDNNIENIELLRDTLGVTDSDLEKVVTGIPDELRAVSSELLTYLEFRQKVNQENLVASTNSQHQLRH